MARPTRKVEIERLFFLGNFKNLRINNTIDNIPYEVWTNPEAVEKITFLLLIAADRDFRRYQLLNKQIGGMSLEDSLAYLNDLRDETYKEIQDLLSNGNVENSEEGNE